SVRNPKSPTGVTFNLHGRRRTMRRVNSSTDWLLALKRTSVRTSPAGSTCSTWTITRVLVAIRDKGLMPDVNIRITREGATAEQKAALIRGVTQLLVDVLRKDPETSIVAIDEIETDNWGVDGVSVTGHRQREKASIRVDLSTQRTVVIGGREWTAENLNIRWPGSWPPNGDETLAAKYGRLYTYEMAVEIASRASGWRLPNQGDV